MESQQQQQQLSEPDSAKGITNSLKGAALSPNKRYVRWNDVISKSGGVCSFKGFDTKNGIEVVWHKIDLNSLDESEQSRVTDCVKTVKNMNSKNIVEYQGHWLGEEKCLHLITARLETLRDFIGKVKTLRWRIVKKWARQILRGLRDLHCSSPKVVHCNLMCSHIYINGGTSHTNIGDLWQATILPDDEAEHEPQSWTDYFRTTVDIDDCIECEQPSPTRHVVVAYKAPDELLTTAVDVYSFGMCLLEMITREEPYREFHEDTVKIQNKAAQGVLPKVLRRVALGGAHDFIALCLKPSANRPTAAELLEHAFLSETEDDDKEIITGEILQCQMIAPYVLKPSRVPAIIRLYRRYARKIARKRHPRRLFKNGSPCRKIHS